MALLAARRAHDDHRAVHLIQLGAQRRVNQRACHGEDLDGLFAQHEAGEIEVVDRHVAEEPAGRLEVRARRQLGVAPR